MKPTHLHDGDLIAAFGANRNEAAFGELVRRHAPMVFRTCRRITGNDPDAEDAAQQVFATLVVQADKLTSMRSVAGWLYETAWHVSMRVRRAQGVRRRHEPRALRPGPSDLNGTPDEELLHELYRAIEMLPPTYREAVVLYHLSGLTVEQVSALMMCGAGTTAARLSRARAMLRERFRWRDIALPIVALDAMLSLERADGAVAYELRGWAAMTPHQWSMAGGAGGNAAELIAAAVKRASPYPAPTLSTAATAAVASGSAGIANWLMAACIAGTIIALPLHAGGTGRSGNPGGGGSSKSFRTTGSGDASREERSPGYHQAPRDAFDSGNSSSSVPEPGGFSILAAGAALALRRRSRRPTHCG